MITAFRKTIFSLLFVLSIVILSTPITTVKAANDAKGWCTATYGDKSCTGTPQPACEIQHGIWGGNSTLEGYSGTKYWWYKECNWNTCYGIGNSDCSQIHPATISFECGNEGVFPGAPEYLVRVAPGRCIPNSQLQQERSSPCPTAGNSSPNPTAGNPIIIQTGAKIEVATDFETSDTLFNLTRHYRSFTSSTVNSYLQVPLGLAQSWRFGFAWELHIDDGFYVNNDVTLHAPDGSAYNFERNNNGELEPADSDAAQIAIKLEFVGDWPSDLREIARSSTQWKLTDVDNTTYLLQAFVPSANRRDQYLIAHPIQITSLDGYQQSLSYGDLDELLTITDSFSRVMHFQWQTGEQRDGTDVKTVAEVVTAVSFPDGSSAEYSYSSTDELSEAAGIPERLTTVTRKDSSDTVFDSMIYHYENTDYPFALTGITDNRGVRTASWSYDNKGRAVSSEAAGGLNRTTITYDDDDSPSRTVTNTLGKKTVYHYQRGGSFLKPTFRLINVEGKPSANCVGSKRRFAYNDDGFFAYTDDDEGNRTRYKYDNNSQGLATRIIEAAGTDAERTVKYQWNLNTRQPTHITDPRLLTSFYYDDVGRLVKVHQTDKATHTLPYSTSGQTRTWHYGYSDEGLLLHSDGPLSGTGDRIYYSYDAQGYLSRIKDENDHVTIISNVNDRGQPTNIRDPNGVRTRYSYDSRGLLSIIKVESSDNPTWRFTYDEIGNLIVIKQPDGSFLRYYYDDANRIRKVNNNLNEAIYYSHDAMGNVTREVIKDASNALTFQQHQAFDELGRLLSHVGASSQQWRYSYDRNNNLTSIEDPASHTKSYGYDGLNRIISTLDQEQTEATLARDEQGNLSSYQDARNVKTDYVRNGWGEIIREVSPDRGTIDYIRDARGLITEQTDARGIVTRYSYDGAGRLLKVEYPAEAALNVTYSYDSTTDGNAGIGRLTRITDGTGITAYHYDGQGNIANVSQTIGGKQYSTQYHHTTDRLDKLVYPSGLTLRYGYDGVGRVVSLEAEQGAQTIPVLTSITTAPFGPVSRLTFANGISESRPHNQDYRLSLLHVASGNGDIIKQGYSYGDGRYVTAIDDLLSATYSQQYGYSPTGRLTTASGAWGNTQVGYDSSGNRTSLLDDDISQSGIIEDGSNRLLNISGTRNVSYSHDAAGNQIAANDTDYRYNAAGQLSVSLKNGATLGSYSYNSANQLTIHTTQIDTRHYLYDEDGHRLSEADSTGTVLRDYVWLGDRPVAFYQHVSNQLFAIHTDHLDRPIALTDQNGSTVWRAHLKPWGKPHSIIGTIDVAMRFPGQWDTPENALFYNWHRYYDFETGRYITSDPIGLEGGINTYLYANANPLNYVDRDGLAVHRKNKRPSSLNKHQQADSRRTMDRGGEKGDRNRNRNRKRPKWHTGAWPPKTGLFLWLFTPPALLDPCLMGIGECDKHCT